MNTPKPYGLDKEQDLRWEALALAACTMDTTDPLAIVVTADMFADFVSKGFDPAEYGLTAPEVTSAAGANVLSFARRPA